MPRYVKLQRFFSREHFSSKYVSIVSKTEEVLRLKTFVVRFNLFLFLTNALISGVEEFCERSGRSFVLDERGSFLVSCQFAKHTRSHPLNVLDLIVEKLKQKESFLKIRNTI